MTYFADMLDRFRSHQAREQEKAAAETEIKRQIAEQNDLYLASLRLSEKP